MSPSYKLVEIDQISNLIPGTQIAVKGEFQNLHASLANFYPLFSSEKYYYHHGVYLGNCQVAHFSGVNKSDAKPGKCDILQFWKNAADGKLYKVEYDDPGLVLPVEETLQNAEAVLAQPSVWPGYQIINNNCESFATWLKTGVKASAQAVKGIVKIIPLAVVGGLGVSSLPAVASISSHR